MKKYRNEAATTTAIGIDLGDRYSYVVALDESGEVIEDGRIKTSERAMALLSERHPLAQIAMGSGDALPLGEPVSERAGS